MCLKPVTIINPSKYINLNRQDQYLLQVPCGVCAECRSQLSNQWLFRTFQEFKDCLVSGSNFVYFDSLTYDNSHIPTIKEVIPSYPFDFPIFNSNHTHKFLDSLDKRLARKYDSSFRYFLSSEYGEKKGRPHYHILLFVYGNITPLELSAEISDLWKYGRTDGYPYKSAHYVNTHNTIKENNKETMCRTANYVTKYVQKSCKYDKLLFDRVSDCVKFYANKLFEMKQIDNLTDFFNSKHSRCVREMFARRIGQYHRQSQQFGASVLGDLDLNKLVVDGCLFMPHYKYVSIAVPIPMYYKRKLFQEQIKVDGVRVWQNTEVGVWFKKKRHSILKKKIQDRYNCVASQYNFHISKKLSEYVLERRGRFVAPLPPSENMFQRLESVHLYNYCSKSDVRHFDIVLISDKYFGNSTIGYTLPRGTFIEKEEFINSCVYIDCRMEEMLDKISSCQSDFNDSRNNLMPLLQRLRNVHFEKLV